MRAFRVGSPNSLRPRKIKAITRGQKDFENSSTSGKIVKNTNVMMAKGFFVFLSASQATGI